MASTGGDYIYGVPSREPGVAATAGVLDSYRLVLGSRDVPLGVELALEGAQIACAWVMRGPAPRHRAARGTQLSLSSNLNAWQVRTRAMCAASSCHLTSASRRASGCPRRRAMAASSGYSATGRSCRLTLVGATTSR